MFSKPLARFAAFSILSALSISVFGVSAAWAEAVTFTLVNRSNRDLEAFYVAHPNESDWGEDILGKDILFPGESVEITIDDGRTDCLYDIKGLLGPGENVGSGELIQTDVNICDGAVYEYYAK